MKNIRDEIVNILNIDEIGGQCGGSGAPAFPSEDAASALNRVGAQDGQQPAWGP